MSGFSTVATELGDWISKLRQEIPAEFHHLLDEGHSIAAKLRGEAETDAADVVHTAETQGLNPAEHEAVTDAGTLAIHAAEDAAAAVEGGSKPSA